MPQIGQVRLIRQDWHVSRKLSPTLFLASIARRNRCLAARTKETFRSYPFQDDERETLLKAREHALPENFIHPVSAVSPTLFAATRDRKLLFPCATAVAKRPAQPGSRHSRNETALWTGVRPRSAHGGAKDRGKVVDAQHIAPASLLEFHKQLASPNIQVELVSLLLPCTKKIPNRTVFSGQTTARFFASAAAKTYP